MWIDVVFYIVLLSQVILISFYYPAKIVRRTTYVLETCPPEQYPKLYESTFYAEPEAVIRRTLTRFKLMNMAIGNLGIALLIAMAITYYSPHEIKQNGHILFVLLFAILQMVPCFYIEFATWRWHAHVRATVQPSKRTADLRPRRLFDFISPIWVGLAGGLLITWFVLYLTINNDGTPWQWNHYLTMIIFPIQMLFAFKIYRAINGKKSDPHQSYQDQIRNIQTVVQVNIFASIGMSLFLIIMELVNLYRLDMYEPLFLSGYVQFMVIFGIGQLMRTYSIKSVDFDVYKAETA
ncbi:hypothetical protein [Maritalea myrionectae]|uniref:hypothetical protein n=1 Tax=Maritalea myrionectae TaxID=454601 RepID=UPI000409E09B|nr:hypothetical protein [Maritalea myrionectae]